MLSRLGTSCWLIAFLSWAMLACGADEVAAKSKKPKDKGAKQGGRDQIAGSQERQGACTGQGRGEEDRTGEGNQDRAGQADDIDSQEGPDEGRGDARRRVRGPEDGRTGAAAARVARLDGRQRRRARRRCEAWRCGRLARPREDRSRVGRSANGTEDVRDLHQTGRAGAAHAGDADTDGHGGRRPRPEVRERRSEPLQEGHSAAEPAHGRHDVEVLEVSL